MSQENICLALQLKWTLNDTTSVPKTSPGKLNSILLTSLRNDTRFFLKTCKNWHKPDNRAAASFQWLK